MFRIVLPVFFRTEEMKNSPEDVYFKFTEYDIKDVIFYEITALGTYREDGIDYTTIHVSGDTFYSPLSIAEIDQKVISAKTKFMLQ